MASQDLKSGFTLVELSLVLVIIGLVIGGVLVGRDLIKATEIRAQVSQIEKYNTAVHTFQSKYNCLPGDCGSAANFGMAARNGAPGRGNNNGLLDGGVEGSPAGTRACAETVLFWQDLGFAQLIVGSYIGGDGDPTASSCTTAATSDAVFSLLPRAKIGKENAIAVYEYNQSFNYYEILGVNSATIGGDGKMVNASSNLSPSEAFQIDAKIDDGFPASGSVSSTNIPINGTAPFFALAAPVPVIGSCTWLPSTVLRYTTDNDTAANTNACKLLFRFQ
jgi:prepilin-type N-terminal cleavage/methylation domain-containing protein